MDGKVDQITAGGCATFNSEAIARKPLMCSPYYSPDGVTEKDGQNYGYPAHSYMIKENSQ